MDIKCKLKTCLNCENGNCTNSVPTIIPKLVPNKVSCPFFDDDFKKSYEEYKRRGGTLGAVAMLLGRRTPKELEDLKNEKKKPRKDKGNKRKSKKENSLKEIM